VAAANAALALATQRLDRIERETAAMRARIDRNQGETAAIRQQIVRHQVAGLARAPFPAEPVGVPPARDEDDDDALLARALALSLAELDEDDLRGAPPCGGALHLGAPEGLEARKQREEQLTAQALGAVECLQIAAAEHGDGTIRIGAQRYCRVEHGSTYGGHTNLCFYLAATGGMGPLAVQLKEELAPGATALSQVIGAGVDFAAPAARADTEVVRMFVLQRRVAVVVYNSRARVATSHWAAGGQGATVYLHTDGYHYQRLVPV